MGERSVLLVEHDEAVYRDVQDALSLAGVKVLRATSSLSARAAILEHNPALVIVREPLAGVRGAAQALARDLGERADRGAVQVAVLAPLDQEVEEDLPRLTLPVEFPKFTQEVLALLAAAPLELRSGPPVPPAEPAEPASPIKASSGRNCSERNMSIVLQLVHEVVSRLAANPQFRALEPREVCGALSEELSRIAQDERFIETVVALERSPSSE